MTFSVEHDFDETTITIMDDTAELEDVKIFITDEGIDLLQVACIDEYEIFNGISFSHEMIQDLLAAYNSSEGIYRRV